MIDPDGSRRIAKAIQSGITIEQRIELIDAMKNVSSLEEMPDWVQTLVKESENSAE